MRGTVVRFERRRGYGFIQPKKEGEKQIYVHYSGILSDERFPELKAGTEVDYEITTTDRGIRAENVQLPDGTKITNHKPEDYELDEETTYTGMVIFFYGKKGYGYISPDKDIMFKGEFVSADPKQEEGTLYVAREDILFDKDSIPCLDIKSRVQFHVYKSILGLGAYKVLHEDGTPYKFKWVRRKKAEEGEDKAQKGTEEGATKESTVETIKRKEPDEGEEDAQKGTEEGAVTKSTVETKSMKRKREPDNGDEEADEGAEEGASKKSKKS